MRSSATVMCRALVMLVCVVAIPLVALFGTSARDFVSGFLAGHKDAWPAEARPLLSEAPRFEPGPQPTAPGPGVQGVPPTPVGSTAHAPPLARQPVGKPRAVPAPQRGTISASYETPAPVATDPLTEIQRRLRELGATHYALEFWGDREQLYRFSCEVAIGAGSNYNRHFEATDADRLQAMARVLQEVEAWRLRQ